MIRKKKNTSIPAISPEKEQEMKEKIANSQELQEQGEKFVQFAKNSIKCKIKTIKAMYLSEGMHRPARKRQIPFKAQIGDKKYMMHIRWIPCEDTEETSKAS